MIEELFSTPLYVSQLDNFEEIKTQLGEVLPDIGFTSGNHYLTDPTFTEDLLLKYNLYKLRNELDRHIREYCKHLNYECGEYVIKSWLSMYKKGQYAHIHEHGHYDIAGVVYFQTNGEDGDIFFTSANPFLSISKIFQNMLSMSWTHKPIPGKILLFPGWLSHGVRTNDTDNTRISFSFNVLFK